MGFAHVNVWITDIGHPCRMSSQAWRVWVWQCDGTPLEWCGKVYGGLSAECGHLELELPPGCYVIWGYLQQQNNFVWTDRAVVQACCDEHHCVTLYAGGPPGAENPTSEFEKNAAAHVQRALKG
jgi:hypothetical protein